MGDEGFPRGGKKVSKGKKFKSKEDKPLLSDDGEINVKSRKKEKSSEDKKKDKFMKLDKKLELPSISYETLVEGTLCLGCVKKVQESSLLIGLPGMTVGSVDINSISTPYKEILEKLEKDEVKDDEVIYPLDNMFKVGDIVVVKVMNVTLNETNGKQKHRVTLSLNPKDIHQEWMATDLSEDIVMTGAIKSKEDKGYIVDLGIKGVNAFLPNAIAGVLEKKLHRPFGIGQLISVCITNCQIKRLMARVTLNCSTAKVKQIQPPEGQGIKLLPGMKVSCIIVEKRSSGLMVSFLDSSIGRVHNDHLAERHRADVSDTIVGRILFIPPWDVGPYLTFDEVNTFPYEFDYKKITQQLKSGDSRRRRGTVTLLEPRGALVRLHGGGIAILKRQRASDKLDYTDEQFKKDFKLRSEHDFRVLEYSQLDGLFIVSCQEHLLDPKNVIILEELIPGSEHQVIIESYNKGGALLKVGSVKGFLPYLHFKDSVLSSQFVQKKFPPGSKLPARVFQIDLSKNSAIFTAKKTLRLSKGLVAATYSDLKVGSRGHGVVRFISPNDVGIQIQMIGGLLGFIPKSKIPHGSTDSSIPLVDRFPLGLPVEFKVTEVNVEKRRSILTLDLEAEIPLQKNMADRKRKIVNSESEEISVSAKKSKKRKRKGKSAAAALTEESDEIPQLIPIDTTNQETRKRKLSDTPSVDPKKNKLSSKTTQNTVSELTKIEKKKFNKKQKLKQDVKEIIEVKKENDDSGIEDETSGLKLATKSFWDIVPPSEISVKKEEESSQSGSEESEQEEETAAEYKIEVKEEEVEGGEEEKLVKKKPDTKQKKGPAVDENMTEKDHELHLIQNSSDPRAWKSFKDFTLRHGDPAKAVSIIKQMKDKIPFRDEKGKLYCWMAILQIETQYGTEASVKSTLEEALKVNDPLAILDRLAQLYESMDKADEAEEMYRRRLKMQLHQPDSWINLGLFLYKHKKLEAARQLLPSALHQLSESNQIYVTAKFAKLEIEHGEIEKGRSMFLTICLQRPKRTDLWLLYANSLYKMKEFQLAGDALRTALGSKHLNPKESRPLIKRLVEIEKQHGTPESIEKLKEEAAGYLNLITSTGA